MGIKKLFRWLLFVILTTSCQVRQKDMTDSGAYDLRVDKKNIQMVLIPDDGSFIFGTETIDDTEKETTSQSQRLVSVSEFYIDVYEVTNAEYQKCVDAGECLELNREKNLLEQLYYDWNKFDMSPVTLLSWNEAQSYCLWRGARLPTEAEWEKAARGTEGYIYPWGESIDCSYANYGFYSTNGKMCMGGENYACRKLP